MGVRVGESEYQVVAVATESGTETVLWTWVVTPAEGDPTEPSDIAMRPPEAAVILARCCEPTSGHVHSVPLDGSEEVAQVDQGYRFDLAGSVFARVDAFTGMLGIKPAFPGFTGQWIQEEAGAFDVAVSHDGSAVVTLVVPEIDANGIGTESAVVVYTTEPGEPADSHRWPVPEHRYCNVVALDHGLVGLMVGEPDRGDSGLWACMGSTLDLFDYSTGEFSGGVVDLGAAVRHVSTDDTGGLIIATTVDGSVTWSGPDGSRGTLADTGFLVADW
ncbi:hypothetical protein BH24ACT7_BH24ACT7_15640 [soil metagenome]